MTIRTKQEGVPSKFEPARLFLDDIDEIVRIFQEAVQSHQAGNHTRVEDLKLKITFSLRGRVCDDLQDLPKIARKATNFNIDVSTGIWVSAWLVSNRSSTNWGSSGFTEEERWRIFRKLQPIYRRRKLHWRILVHAYEFLAIVALQLAPLGTLTGVGLLLSKRIPPIPAIAISLFFLLLGVAVAMGFFRHTTVNFRHSSEPSPLGNYIKDKLIPVFVGVLLGIGGTLLEEYVRHTYWP